MSAAVETYRDEMEATYAVDFNRDREPIKSRKRFPEYRRTGGAPTRVSGMHCRRSKKWTWGSGRGARMSNLRAFAGALALAVASVASSAFGITIDMVTVGNAGNAGNAGADPSGLGAVPYVFQIAETETTNDHYISFLNTVDAVGDNPNGIYNTFMGSSSLGGIEFNPLAAAGSKYTAKSGMGSRPVNYLTWFSAARFVNWLENGQGLEFNDGTYSLGNTMSGNVVARNPGSTYVLPSADEWYKAAFFDGATYTDYQTNSNIEPTASLPTAAPNTGNFANIVVDTVDVASYANSASAYGAFDMLGNVNEMTDTSAGSGLFRSMGGGYNALLDSWMATSSAMSKSTIVSLNAGGPNFGFRVAAVPEPGTIALAGAGLAGLAGLEWKRRRKTKVAGAVLTA